MVLTCRHANLSGNHIGTRGAQALASVIPVCQPLQTLGLSRTWGFTVSLALSLKLTCTWCSYCSLGNRV